jgi:putative Ca2+/H+ antiporter (TMEM165/GDT1 family)
MIADLLVPLVAIGLAEVGDKSQLSILLLSSKTTRHSHLLLGVILAFLVVDGVAVLVGSWITSIVPINLVKMVSGVLFVIFGVLTLRADDTKEDSRLRFNSPFVSGFAFIFMTEWGDKTQIASALFAAKYDPLMVLAGTMTALTLLSTAAVYLGRIVSTRINRKALTKIAGIAFVLIGVSFFFL